MGIPICRFPWTDVHVQIKIVLDLLGDLQQAVYLDCGKDQQRHLQTVDR